MAFDKSFIDLVSEEFAGVRMTQLMRGQRRPLVLGEISHPLKGDETRLVGKLREMVSEGLITRTHKDGVAHYSLR